MTLTTARRTQTGHRYRGFAAGLVLVALFLSACSGNKVSLQEDQQLVERAQQVIRNAKPVPLREIIEGDWDRVHVFPGPTLQESVEKLVGTSVDMPDIHNYGGIILLMKGKTVQRAIEFRTKVYPFDGNGASYGPNATATPMPTNNPSWLRLAENGPLQPLRNR